MTVVQIGEGLANSGSTRPYMSFTIRAWVIYGAIAWTLSFLSPNLYLTFASLMALPVFVTMLWRVGEPPILFFCVAFQWLQVCTKVFHADVLGLSIEDYAMGWTISDAIWLSLIGLLVLSCGIRLALANFKPSIASRIRIEIESLSTQKIWYAYLAIYLVTFFGEQYIWLIPRLSQILLMVFQLKWVLFFMLALTVIGKKEGYTLLLAAFLLEVFSGFTGFFANYKQVFFVLAIVLMTFLRELNFKLIGRLLLLVAAVGYLAVIWSAIKQEYRDYLNQGTGLQVVLVPLSDRTSKLLDLYLEADWETFEHGVEALAERIAYVDYFARVLDMVPSGIPHAEGEMWSRAVKHVLTPRLLFPEKAAVVSDTEDTQRYTGYRLIEQGGNVTTIPLGYFTESYIDFGRYGMMVPLFLVGLVWGFIYRYFLSTSRELLFGYSLVVAVLITASTFEISTIKMVGGVLMGFIVLALLQKWVVPIVHRRFEVDLPARRYEV